MDAVNYEQLKKGEVNLGVGPILLLSLTRLTMTNLDINHGSPVQGRRNPGCRQPDNYGQLHRARPRLF
jgi:hypothetical protein